MPTTAPGHKSFLLIAKESTFGTAPGTATDKIDVESFEWDQNMSAIADPNMNSSGASPRSIVQGLQFVTGRFRVRVGFGGFEELFRFCLPNYSSAVADTTARDHTFKEPTNTGLSSYTIDWSAGDVPSGKVTRFLGTVCTGWRFTLVPGQSDTGVMILDIDFVAASVAENTTPMAGSLTVTNLLAVPFHLLLRTGSNLLDGSGLSAGNIYIKSLALDVTYPHDAARGFLGSVAADTAIRNGPMNAMVDIEYAFKIKVPEERLQTIVTVQDTIQLVQEYLGAVNA